MKLLSIMSLMRGIQIDLDSRVVVPDLQHTLIAREMLGSDLLSDK